MTAEINSRKKSANSASPLSKAPATKMSSRKHQLSTEVQRWAYESIIDQFDLALSDEEDQQDTNGKIQNTENSVLSIVKPESEENTSTTTTTKNKTSKKKPTKSGFKLFNNSMSRLMPGVIQKNVTAERGFVKELMKLSQQRYISMLNLDFQNRVFVNRQSRKGIIQNENRRSYSDLKMSSNSALSRSGASSANGYQSADVTMNNSISNNNTATDTSSVRTFNSSKSARKPANLIQTMKLNSILAKMHMDDVNSRRSGSSSLSATRPLDTSSKLSMRRDSTATLSKTKLKSDELKVIEDIIVINAPASTVVTTTEPRKSITSLKSTLQRQPTFKSRNVTIQDINQIFTQNNINDTTMVDPTLNPVKYPVQDDRYKGLMTSMTSVYLGNLDDNHLSVNERIARIISSNNALNKGGETVYDRIFDRMKRTATYEENLKLFERSITNVI